MYSSELKQNLQDIECAYNTMDNWVRDLSHKIGDKNKLLREVKRKANEVDKVRHTKNMYSSNRNKMKD